jgi:hypothetical protein
LRATSREYGLNGYAFVRSTGFVWLHFDVRRGMLVESGSSDVLPPRTTARNVSAELTAGGPELFAGVMEHRRKIIDGTLARLTPQAQRRLARGRVDFAQAAGERSDPAWELGWSLDKGRLPTSECR